MLVTSLKLLFVLHLAFSVCSLNFFPYMQQFTNDVAYQGIARFIIDVFTVLYISWAVITADKLKCSCE